MATGLLRPRASVIIFLVPSPKRCLTETWFRIDRTSSLSSRVLLLASPVHDGIVGRYPVAEVTLTLVPMTLETR